MRRSDRPSVVHLLASLCLLTSGTIGAGLFLAPTPALAVPAKPPTDWSYYVLDNNTGTAYTLGCDQGKSDAKLGVNSIAFLDFGGQQSNGSGTILINDTPIPNSDIEAFAENFAYGYWQCTGSDTTTVLYLAIGTNNSAYDVSSSGGSTWAGVVAAVQNSTLGQDAAPQVTYWGGSDIESWGGKTATESWATGWNSATSRFYVDYGSADQCSETAYNNQPCGNTGYYQYDYWWLSYGLVNALCAPDIYVSGLAQQWEMISHYGYSYQGKRIYFEGPLDEYDLNSSTYTPTAAWDALWSALNSSSATADTPPYSLEVHDE